MGGGVGITSSSLFSGLLIFGHYFLLVKSQRGSEDISQRAGASACGDCLPRGQSRAAKGICRWCKWRPARPVLYGTHLPHFIGSPRETPLGFIRVFQPVHIPVQDSSKADFLKLGSQSKASRAKKEQYFPCQRRQAK